MAARPLRVLRALRTAEPVGMNILSLISCVKEEEGKIQRQGQDHIVLFGWDEVSA